MSSLYVHTTHFTTQDLTTMNDATFNFRLDTLIDEINMHPYKDEIIQLMHEQVIDDLTTEYLTD